MSFFNSPQPTITPDINRRHLILYYIDVHVNTHVILGQLWTLSSLFVNQMMWPMCCDTNALILWSSIFTTLPSVICLNHISVARRGVWILRKSDYWNQSTWWNIQLRIVRFVNHVEKHTWTRLRITSHHMVVSLRVAFVLARRWPEKNTFTLNDSFRQNMVLYEMDSHLRQSYVSHLFHSFNAQPIKSVIEVKLHANLPTTWASTIILIRNRLVGTT